MLNELSRKEVMVYELLLLLQPPPEAKQGGRVFVVRVRDVWRGESGRVELSVRKGLSNVWFSWVNKSKHGHGKSSSKEKRSTRSCCRCRFGVVEWAVAAGVVDFTVTVAAR